MRATSAKAANRTSVEQGRDKPFSDFGRFVARSVLASPASQINVAPNRAE